jgi:[ribosomal protein S5]-alanine N-acetyltransferase
MILETNRLVLRLLENSDGEPLARMWSNPKVTQYSTGGPRDFQEVKNLIEEYSKTPPKHRFTVTLKETGQVIGDCGLVDKEVEQSPKSELIYFFDPTVWKKGFATEAAKAVLSYAVEQLKLDEIIALIHPENSSSENVALKIGMSLEREIVHKGRVMRLYAYHAKKD